MIELIKMDMTIKSLAYCIFYRMAYQLKKFIQSVKEHMNLFFQLFLIQRMGC